MEEKKSEVKVSVGETITLDLLPVGCSGVIVKIENSGRIKRRLFDMGLTPNTEVFVRKKAPLGDPIEITIRGYELSLRKAEAEFASVKITEVGGNK